MLVVVVVVEEKAVGQMEAAHSPEQSWTAEVAVEGGTDTVEEPDA